MKFRTQMRVRPIQKSRKPERDRIWFGTMKCLAFASASTEAARNHSSSSIAVITDSASSESGQLRYGRFREPAGGGRSYAQPRPSLDRQVALDCRTGLQRRGCFLIFKAGRSAISPGNRQLAAPGPGRSSSPPASDGRDHIYLMRCLREISR